MVGRSEWGGLLFVFFPLRSRKVLLNPNMEFALRIPRSRKVAPEVLAFPRPDCFGSSSGVTPEINDRE